MLESLPVVLTVATALGFLSGLGVGGGSLLVLWLTFVLDVEPTAARAVNLLFFLPSASAACFFRWRRGSLHLRKILPAILAGTASGVLFSFLATAMDIRLMKKLFGILLIFTGLRELFQKAKKPSS